MVLGVEGSCSGRSRLVAEGHLPVRGAVVRAAEGALGEVVGEGIFAVGGQLAVVWGDELVADVAVGVSSRGGALGSGDLHNVYCLVKPFSYLLLAHVLEGAGYGADDLLDGVVGLPSWCPGGITLRRLGCHEAGLGEPSAMDWRWTPSGERTALLHKRKRSQGPAYSEVAGGLVCEHVIEQISGRSADLYCVEELLGPLGLLDDVILDAGGAESVRGRVQAPVAGLPVSPLPMLSELLPSQMGEISLALGALATMRGVAQLFAAVGRVLSGVRVSGLPSPSYLGGLMRDDRPVRDDPVLGREAKWSGGLMVELGRQVVSRFAGQGSVGHVGGLANSAALFDPTRDASVAVYLNGVGAVFEDQGLPRQRALDSVLDAIPVR